MCPVCHVSKRTFEKYPGATLRPQLIEQLQKQGPDWGPEQSVCQDCLNQARSALVESYLLSERGELNEAEIAVVEAIRSQELITTSPFDDEDDTGFGARVSDRIAEIGGSWAFIISFVCLLVCWIGLNTFALRQRAFDPYPYILLNLLLSCIAALQAPVIMMSQNRQEAKDRRRAEADYKTNLKAELEIKHLHIKLDQLLTHQWQRLLEIQQLQLDAIRDSARQPPKGP